MKQFPTRAGVLAAFALMLAISVPAGAQQPATPAPQPAPGTQAGEAEMMAAMEKMSAAMAAAPMTGNPDKDFAAMMIPHHAGAIDMARFELAHGTDPAMRKLAEDIVAAQEKEIAEMKAWQGAH